MQPDGQVILFTQFHIQFEQVGALQKYEHVMIEM